MIGVEGGIGTACAPPLHSQGGGVSYGRLPEGRIEKGFKEHAGQVGGDPLRVHSARFDRRELPRLLGDVDGESREPPDAAVPVDKAIGSHSGNGL